MDNTLKITTMKKATLMRKSFGFSNLLIAIIITFLFTSCSSSREQTDAENKSYDAADSCVVSLDTPVNLDDYKVILAVDENIYMNEIGELRVWIGVKGVNISFSQGMVQDESTIPASIGQYAKITPYAPDFDITPSEMACIKIDPSGSDVRFSLKPKKQGAFKVSANIELFNEVGCIGIPVPKAAQTLTVVVKIDKSYVITSGVRKMAIVLWDKFLSFWGILITLLFSTLLFLVRRKIKSKTGYDGKEDGE